MFMGMSGLTGLLALAAAIVLFIRSRSAATGLFLAGTAVHAVSPFTISMFGYGLPFMAIMTLANICASVGLLWYAIQLPKAGAAAVAPATASADGTRFFK
jgi:hypothetical protein